MRIFDVFLTIAAGLMGYPFFMLQTFLVDYFVGEKSFVWRWQYEPAHVLYYELLEDWKSTLPIFMIISVLMMLAFSLFRENHRLAYLSIFILQLMVMVYLFFMGLSIYVLSFSFITLLFFTFVNSRAKGQ